MSRLVMVSNRVPVGVEARARAGGLAVAVRDTLEARGGLWFGWNGRVASRVPARPRFERDGRITYATFPLSRRQYNEYYNGYANRVLWPLFHYLPSRAAFSRQEYTGYLDVNAVFARKLAPFLRRDDLIWVHDYHLIPLGEMLRANRVKGRIGFFLHTPFPAMEILTAVPAQRDLVRALCGYDLVGFQTENDLRAFHGYILYEAGGSISKTGRVRAFGRSLKAGAFPIGIDTTAFGCLASEVAGRQPPLGGLAADRSYVIGVDRLDYSKGLVERVQAFRRFLAAHPQHRGKVTLLQIAPTSRAEIPEYRQVRRDLEVEASRVNGRYGDLDWVPIYYLNRSFLRAELAGLYRASRIGLVTPLRDGMNLVAKEYVAAQDPKDPGVLVLSRFAGAARELDAALIVNPFNLDSVADAIAQGLAMPREERRRRWKAMMRKLRANTLAVWRDRYLKALMDCG